MWGVSTQAEIRMSITHHTLPTTSGPHPGFQGGCQLPCGAPEVALREEWAERRCRETGHRVGIFLVEADRGL